MPEEAVDLGSTSETPAETIPSPTTTESSPAQFSYTEDRSSWVRPEVVQRLYEENQRYRGLGSHEELNKLREREQRLIEAVAPQGRRWNSEQEAIRQAWRDLHPEWETAGKLTPQHLAILERLTQHSDQLNSLGDLQTAVQEMRAAQANQASAMVASLAKERGLGPKAARRIEAAISHEIQADPRALVAYLRGDADIKARIAAHFAPGVIEDLYGEKGVREQAALQNTKEAVAGLPATPGRGAPAGSQPAKRPDETELNAAHRAVYEELEQHMRG